MKRLLLMALLISSVATKAQTLGNMPFTTPQLTNPALIALNDLPQLNVYGQYRRLFTSTYVGYNQYSKTLKGTWGIFHNSVNANRAQFDDLRFNLNNFGASYARAFNINDKWKYALGTGIQFSNTARNTNAIDTIVQELRLNVGGVLYANRFFTSLNYTNNIHGIGQIDWRTGYKFEPFKNKDFSITPIVRYSTFLLPESSSNSWEALLNITYKKLNVNLSLNDFGYSIGLGYDFKRFRVNYAIGGLQSNFSPQVHHELGFQFKLGNKNSSKKSSEFNHRLF